jgi:hypothetical protein
MTIEQTKTSILRRRFVQSRPRRCRTLMVSLAIRQLDRVRASVIPWIPCSPDLRERGCERRFNKAVEIHLHADLSRFSPLIRHHFDSSRRRIGDSSEICSIRSGAGPLFGLLFAKHGARWTVEVTEEDDGGKPSGGRQHAVRRRWSQRTIPYSVRFRTAYDSIQCPLPDRHEDAA